MYVISVVQAKLPKEFALDVIHKKFEGKITPTTVVLLQELERYNKLIKKMNTSLAQLQKALAGEVGMSVELDDLAKSLYNGQLPSMWRSLAPATLKSLGNWMIHFMQRHAQYSSWVSDTVTHAPTHAHAHKEKASIHLLHCTAVPVVQAVTVDHNPLKALLVSPCKDTNSLQLVLCFYCGKNTLQGQHTYIYTTQNYTYKPQHMHYSTYVWVKIYIVYNMRVCAVYACNGYIPPVCSHTCGCSALLSLLLSGWAQHTVLSVAHLPAPGRGWASAPLMWDPGVASGCLLGLLKSPQVAETAMVAVSCSPHWSCRHINHYITTAILIRYLPCAISFKGL